MGLASIGFIRAAELREARPARNRAETAHHAPRRLWREACAKHDPDCPVPGTVAAKNERLFGSPPKCAKSHTTVRRFVTTSQQPLKGAWHRLCGVRVARAAVRLPGDERDAPRRDPA